MPFRCLLLKDRTKAANIILVFLLQEFNFENGIILRLT